MPGGCNLQYRGYPEQTPFQEHHGGARKPFSGGAAPSEEVPAFAQSGGRCLVHGKNGSDLCLLLCCTINCGVWKRTRCTRQLLSAELAVWWLLLLGSMTVCRGSFQLCPDTQLLGSPEKSSSVCGLSRWFAAEPLFANCGERHCTTFCVLCLAEGPDRQVVGVYWESCSAQLYWRTSMSVGVPFFFILLLVWRGYAAFQGGKSKTRFLQETWEFKIAKSSWFWSYQALITVWYQMGDMALPQHFPKHFSQITPQQARINRYTAANPCYSSAVCYAEGLPSAVENFKMNKLV